MALIPLEYRVAGIVRFIESGFQIEASVDWFLKKYSHLPAITQAANPRKLVVNILTMGGNGWVKEANVVAFEKALAITREKAYAEIRSGLNGQITRLEKRLEEREHELAIRATENGKQQAELGALRDRAHAAELELARELAASTK